MRTKKKINDNDIKNLSARGHRKLALQIQKERRLKEAHESVMWIKEQYDKIYPQWYQNLNRILVKLKFRRLAGWLTSLYRVKTITKSANPIQIEIYRNNKLIAKNY